MKFACLCLTAILCALGQSQQQGTRPGATFEDLAQRASAAIANDPQQAASLCRQALALRPTWAEGWFDLGAAEYELAHHAEARKAFQRAAELAPAKGAVWGFLGLTEYQLHKYAAALNDIQKAESLGLPDNRGFVSTVRNTAALSFIRAKDFSAAVEQLRPLALLGDDSPNTIQAFGVSALGLPYVPPEVPADKKALVELAGRAEWALSGNRDADAGAALRDMIARYPNESGVHYLNGIYLLAHDPDGARAEFQKELQITPDHVAARLQIAIIDIRAGDAASALPLAREAVRLQPANALAHVVLGRAEMQRNEYANALPELQAAAKLAPSNPQIHLYLQQVYSRLGRTSDAQTEKAAFLRLHAAHDVSGLPELEAGSNGNKK